MVYFPPISITLSCLYNTKFSTYRIQNKHLKDLD